MRLVGKLTNVRDAERFSRFLESEGIRTRVDDDDGEVLVWVIEEDHVDRARAAFREFCDAPTSERFQVRRPPEPRHVEPPPQRSAPAARRSVRGRRIDGARMLTRLLVIHIAAFVAQNAFPDFFYRFLVLRGTDVLQRGRLWQLLTYGFVHSSESLWHIGMNLFGLWMFGRLVAPMLGGRRFLVFYLSAIVCAGLVQAFVQPESTVLGASGGVTAVVLLCATLFPRLQVLLFFAIPMDLWMFALLFVLLDAYGLYSGAGRVAYAAHLGGAAFGLAYRFLFLRDGRT